MPMVAVVPISVPVMPILVAILPPVAISFAVILARIMTLAISLGAGVTPATVSMPPAAQAIILDRR